ncbi:MAG TPA: hypothetical protein ENJ79_11125 [Gammaproteobacteria bacterium]|nr:hypothetical protein [Gammaproteobacteria bacterium]
MHQRFEVHPIDPDDPARLIELVQSRLVDLWIEGGSPRYSPLHAIVQYACYLGARCALLQKDILDPDFTAEHDIYYSRWSQEVPRSCDRIHLFAHTACSADPLEVVDQMAQEKDAYLGFFTLRPIRMNPVGASILRMPASAERHFILSRDSFPVNIAGRSFSVTGTPFMQQDNAVGACAQTSIWMALRTLYRREGHAAFTPAEITSAATRFLINGRILPNRGGLVIEQVAEAVRAAGYSPHQILLKDTNQSPEQNLAYARRTLYPYVESGIPVLVVLERDVAEAHAMLLIGHSWQAAPEDVRPIGKLADTLDVHDASDWAQPFFVHNDNSGPYLPLPAEDEEDYALAHASVAIPFLPAETFIDGNEARLASLRLLDGILRNIDSLVAADHASGAPAELPASVVTRTYLQEKSAFRRAVLEGDVSEQARRYYRLKWLPRRVWVTEINAFEDYGRAPEGKARRLGEILLDPASEPEDSAFLAIHLHAELLPGDQGIIIERDAFSGEVSTLPLEEDRPSKPLIR